MNKGGRRVLDSVGTPYRLYLMGDQNEWVWYKVGKYITGMFRVPCKNEIEGDYQTSVMKGSCPWVINVTSKVKQVHQSSNKDGMKFIMIDLLLVKRSMHAEIKTVNECTGMGHLRSLL